MLERLTPARIARSVAYRTRRFFSPAAAAKSVFDDFAVRKMSYFLATDLFAAKTKLLMELAAIPYPENYAVSKRWRQHLDTLLKIANRLTSPSELAWFAQHVFDLEPTPVTPAIYEAYQIESRRYRERFPELAKVTESSFLTAGEIATIDGMGYSAKLAQAFSYYADIQDGVGDMNNIKTVVEIGSGHGRMARLMRILDPSRKYVLVDLPESLFFAYSFLRSNFPDARMRIVSPGETITDLGDIDFLFCPVQLLPNLNIPGVDLVINTYSFAEMTQGCADYLLNGVERVIKPRFLYSLNVVFVNKQEFADTGGHDGEGNETVLKLGPSWSPRRFVLVPGVHDGLVRITGSVVLERRELPYGEVVRELVAREESTSDLQELAGLRFFRAAWTRDNAAFDRFCETVTDVYQSFGYPPPNLSEIGEVKFLKAKQARLN